MRFHIKSLSYHHYAYCACTDYYACTMQVLCLLFLYYAYYAYYAYLLLQGCYVIKIDQSLMFSVKIDSNGKVPLTSKKPLPFSCTVSIFDSYIYRLKRLSVTGPVSNTVGQDVNMLIGF